MNTRPTKTTKTPITTQPKPAATRSREAEAPIPAARTQRAKPRVLVLVVDPEKNVCVFKPSREAATFLLREFDLIEMNEQTMIPPELFTLAMRFKAS